MLSPHPSYPPLEMAEAGVLTITNKYGCKDLSRRFADVISIEQADPELLAEAIEVAVREAEARRIGRIIPRQSARDVASDAHRLYSPQKLADIIRSDVCPR
jgi:beta-1,2-rhamnosyltransferase WsaF-like protein